MDQYQRGQWSQLHNPTDPATRPPAKTRTQQQLGKDITKLINAGQLSRAASLLNSPGGFTTDPNRTDDIDALHKRTNAAVQQQHQPDANNPSPTELEADVNKAL